MMKKSKAHYYKKTLIFILISFSIFTSCGKNPPVKFCEGVTPKGKGVKCGKKFSTGDVTALITPKDKITSENITLKVYKAASPKKKFLFSETIKVPKEYKFLIHNIRFINPGKFDIIIFSDKKNISQGSIEIVE